MGKRVKTKFVVSMQVPEDRVLDMLVGAVEGGSYYWCKKVTPSLKSKEKDFYLKMLDGFTAIDADGNVHEVTSRDFQKALDLMLEKEPRHFGDMMSENDDALTADIFFQFCVLKEVIYG